MQSSHSPPVGKDPPINTEAQWAHVKCDLSPLDYVRLKQLKRMRGCRYLTDAIRLAINSGLKAEGL
ncbi:MAG TPA: hypothetical protein VGN72_07530 [Tepidisphaeraceae bacterium]|nr:hypothetical protein [Tepidisphaeraceae bacterium]